MEVLWSYTTMFEQGIAALARTAPYSAIAAMNKDPSALCGSNGNTTSGALEDDIYARSVSGNVVRGCE